MTDEKIKIAFSSPHFSKDEIKDIYDSIEEVYPVDILEYSRHSADVLDPVIIVLLAGIPLSTFLIGFFSQMGKDTWTAIKNAFSKVFRKYKIQGKSVNVQFKFKENETEFMVSVTTDKFDLLVSALEMARNLKLNKDRSHLTFDFSKNEWLMDVNPAKKFINKMKKDKST